MIFTWEFIRIYKKYDRMQIGNSKGLIFVMLLAGAFWMSAVQLIVASASTKSQDDIVSGDVINSKYLAITYHKYLNQKDSDVITGTVVIIRQRITRQLEYMQHCMMRIINS